MPNPNDPNIDPNMRGLVEMMEKARENPERVSEGVRFQDSVINLLKEIKRLVEDIQHDIKEMKNDK